MSEPLAPCVPTCPRCGHQPVTAIECSACGIIFSKWAARKAQESQDPSAPDPPAEGSNAPASTPTFDGPGSSFAAPARRAKANAAAERPARPLLAVPPHRVRDALAGLSQMLGAGLSITDALRTLANTAAGRLAGPFRDIADRLENGDTLAGAMSHHPGAFRRSEVAAVRAAERIGDLEPALDALATQLDERVTVRKRIAKSTAYPMVVLILSIFIGPLPSAFSGEAGAYSASVISHLAVVGAILVTVLIALPWVLRYTKVGPELRRRAWSLPWPAGVYTAGARAAYAQALARNIEVGLPAPASLASAAEITADPAVEAATDAILDAIANGQDLTTSLGQTALVAPNDRMLLVAGERSGTLVNALEKIGKRHREKAIRGQQLLMTLLGTLLTIGIFIYVAMGILDAAQGLTQSQSEIFELIESESPILDMKYAPKSNPNF